MPCAAATAAGSTSHGQHAGIEGGASHVANQWLQFVSEGCFRLRPVPGGEGGLAAWSRMGGLQQPEAGRKCQRDLQPRTGGLLLPSTVSSAPLLQQPASQPQLLASSIARVQPGPQAAATAAAPRQDVSPEVGRHVILVLPAQPRVILLQPLLQLLVVRLVRRQHQPRGADLLLGFLRSRAERKARFVWSRQEGTGGQAYRSCSGPQCMVSEWQEVRAMHSTGMPLLSPAGCLPRRSAQAGQQPAACLPHCHLLHRHP